MSLFKKAESSANRLKLFVYGETGTGKTITALSFPNPVVIDTEKGTTHYGRHKEFYVLERKDAKSVNAALDELLEDPAGYKTFVLDSFTVLYEDIVIGYEKLLQTKLGNPGYVLQSRDYGPIKTMVKAIVHKILSLDMNLVVVARAKTKYMEDKFMQKEGIKPDCPEYIPFDFDVVLELHRIDNKGTALVLKDRTNTLPTSFDYTYEKFVEYMGIEGLEREPLVINQKKNLESLNPRNVEIVYEGSILKTAGVTAQQLRDIDTLLDNGNEEYGQDLLRTHYYTESFLDLHEDEAASYVSLLKDLLAAKNTAKVV